MNQDSSVLSLLDIDEYIKKNGVKEVKNANIFGLGKKTFDEQGLWSETIFGRIGSRERRNQFGYIQLATTLINPIVYKMMKNSSESIRDILAEKKYFSLKTDGTFKEDEVGQTGVLFLAEYKDKVDFEKCAKKDKKDIGRFLNKNKDLIFIDKYLIMPPGGIRDMSTDKNEAKKFSSELNMLYEKLISLNSQLEIHKDDLEMGLIFASQLQKILVQIYLWIQAKLEGKQGLLRGTMLRKTLDYSARIVATSSPEIPLGSIGIPWHTLLTLYEPFFFHYVLKVDDELKNLIIEYIKLPAGRSLGYHDLKTFNYSIAKNPNLVSGILKDKLFHVASEISKDKDILVKRDPVTSRTSYYSATPIALPSGRGAVVNAMSCGPQGLDFDGDTLALMPVFSKEALNEVAQLNPAKSKIAWTDPMNAKNQIYKLALDQVSIVYAMTKE